MKNYKHEIAGILMILAVVMSFMLPAFVVSEPVNATAGDTTVYINTSVKARYEWTTNSYTWSYMRSATSCTNYNTPSTAICGWGYSYTGGQYYPLPMNTAFAFDVSSIPTTAQIKSVALILPISTKTDTLSAYSDFYFSAFKTNPGGNGAYGAEDNANWLPMIQQGYSRLTVPKKYSDLTVGVNATLTVPSDKTAEFMTRWTDNKIYIEVLSEQYFQNISPVTTGSPFGQSIAWQSSTATIKVVYVSQPSALTQSLHTNAAVAPATGANGTSNITLETLKCMYGGETISFLMNGDAGNTVNYQLLDQNNQIITSGSNTIRTDGIYSFQYTPATTYSGFVFLLDTDNYMTSPWVSIQTKYATSELTNLCYARYTDYPQYTNAFSSYVVDDGDFMYFHWKTNINPATELANYSFEIIDNGANVVYQATLADIAAYYFTGTTANQQLMSHWRYMVFSTHLPSGVPDYNGIVVDLNLNASRTLYTGFLQPVIVDSATHLTELAPCHTAYWYLTSPDDGMKFNMSLDTYGNGDKPQLSLTIGSEGKIENNLNQGSIVSSYVAQTNFIVQPGQQNIDMVEVANITTDTNDTFVFKLSNPGFNTYVYEYHFSITLKDTPQTVEGGADEAGGFTTGGKLLEYLQNIIGFFHMDSKTGHYILLIILMVVGFMIFHESKLLRVGVPSLILGVFIIVGWVETWLIVLLALGAGFVLFTVFRKGTEGTQQG